jgi:hypothetical protein
MKILLLCYCVENWKDFILEKENKIFIFSLKKKKEKFQSEKLTIKVFILRAE